MTPAIHGIDSPGVTASAERRTGRILRVDRFAIHDGPGIRALVLFKGCPLRCSWCHSPESQAGAPELVVKGDRCIHCGACLAACPTGLAVQGKPGGAAEGCPACGACAASCPPAARELVGREMTVEDLLAEVERDVVFYDRSGGGVTFSGGEPLAQPAFLAETLTACRARGLHTAVETSGFAPREDAGVLASADLVLFDVKLHDEERHLQHTGVSNEPILANLAWLAARHPAVRVRFPLVPGVNDDDANVDAIGRLVASLGVRGVDVLPYHTAGLAKYARLGRACALAGTRPPSADALRRVSRRLAGCGLDTRIGG